MVEPRPCSVHLTLGGDTFADVLLWRKGYQSIVLLAYSTFIWFIFVRAGYNFMSFTYNDETRVWVNYALSIAHDIAVGGNLRLFKQLAVGLWVISFIVSLFDFLTLAYTGVLLSLALSSLYNKHQILIDVKMNEAYKIAQILFHILQKKLLRMIPVSSDKDKKI